VSAVLTARDVEAAAQAGRSSCAVPTGTIVTPLAKDRAAALGVVLSEPAPAVRNDGGMGRPRSRGIVQVNVERLALESRIRVVVRRVLLRRGLSLDGVEDLVAAVMARLGSVGDPGCACGGRR
jgi:hypothetical protein